MSSDIAIRVEGLSKQYRIGKRERSRSLGDSLSDLLTTPLRFARSTAPSDDKPSPVVEEWFWALKDLWLDIAPGEVVGVIGRNGAGKSTLLKILSRITEPTKGTAVIKGRVASLLEVGTGFHPELTGRENVYLNGAILGMTQVDIKRQFDEIVAFAEVDRFIDTPVKRYSSGMQVRLAFAVAAHLDPDVLIVDEVLAVGDASFQEKCLGRMQKSASAGKTVIFVSHNLASIQHLCTRAILLSLGSLAADGIPREVTARYLSSALSGNQVSIDKWADRITTGEAHLTQVDITGEGGVAGERIRVGGKVRFTLHSEIYGSLTDPCFGLIVHSASGEPILDVRSIHAGLRLGRVDGTVVVQGEIPRLGLYPGRYFLSPFIMDAGCTRDIDFPRLCCVLEVDAAPGPAGDLKLDGRWGTYLVRSEWQAIQQS